MGKATLGDGASVTLLEYSEETLNSHYSIKNYGDKRHIIMNESSGCRFFRQRDPSDSPFHEDVRKRPWTLLFLQTDR